MIEAKYRSTLLLTCHFRNTVHNSYALGRNVIFNDLQSHNFSD